MFMVEIHNGANDGWKPALKRPLASREEAEAVIDRLFRAVLIFGRNAYRVVEVQDHGVVEVQDAPHMATLTHPVVGMLRLAETDDVYDICDDIGEMYDLNAIGVIKSRIILCWDAV
jgi:hypothetical protein